MLGGGGKCKAKYTCISFYFLLFFCSTSTLICSWTLCQTILSNLAYGKKLCVYYWNNMTRPYISSQCYRHTKNLISIRSISCSSFQPQLRILRRMSERVFFMFGNHINIIWILQNKKQKSLNLKFILMMQININFN